MSARHGFLVLSLTLATAALAPAQADPPPERAARNDLYGDPLPEFARARLGTVRFRHGAPISGLQFAPDGRSVLSFGTDGVARLWETATGKENRSFPLPDEGSGWELTQDLRTLITCRHGPAILVTDTVTGKPVRTLSCEGCMLGNPCVTPDGRTLAAIATDNNNGKRFIRLWDLTTGKEVRDIVPGPVGEKKMEFGLRQITLSADGKVLIVMGAVENGGAYRFWDLAGTELGKEPVLLVEEAHRMRMVIPPVLSPDAKVLASLTTDPQKGTTISLRDLQTGKKLRDLEVPVQSIRNLVFSPDGRTLIAVEDMANLHVWDLATGQPLPVPALAPDHYLDEIAFSPDSRTIALGSTGRTILVCDVASGKTLHTLSGYQGRHGRDDQRRMLWVRFPDMDLFGGNRQGGSVVFAPDGRLLAGVGEGGIVRLWSLADGKPLGPAAPGHEGEVSALAIAPDGKVLSSASFDGTVRVWELAGARHLRALTMQPEAAGKEPLRPRCVLFSPDGKSIAAGSHTAENLEAFVQLWDAVTGKPGPQLKAGRMVMSLAFTPDGRRLAVGDLAAIHWLDPATGRQVHRFESRPAAKPEADPNEVQEVPQTAAVSPDGRLLAAAGIYDGAISLWETGTGQLRRRLVLTDDQLFDFVEVRRVPRRQMYRDSFELNFQIAFTPDSKLLATVHAGAIHLWDVAGGRELRQFGIPGGTISGLAFSPSAGLLAACSMEGALRFWDLATGTLRAELRAERGGFHSLAFSPDGKTLITGGSDTTVLLWDVDTILKESRPAPRPPSAKELGNFWKQLADLKDPQVNEAMNRLQAAPQLAVPLVRERLKPAAPLDAARVDRLLAELSDERFDVRQQATEELAKLAERVEPLLHKRLKEDPPLEVRQRIGQLLEGLSGFAGRPEQVQALRAVELLERIGTPEAQAVLKTLAGGAPDARLTQDAKASLERLARRATAP